MKCYLDWFSPGPDPGLWLYLVEFQANNWNFEPVTEVGQVSECVGRTCGEDLDHYIQDIQAERKELFTTFQCWVVSSFMGICNNFRKVLDPHTPSLAKEASRRIIPHL